MKKETNTNGNPLVRGTFAILALLFFIGIIIQVFIAGLAVFVDYGQWNFHKNFVIFIEFIPLAMLIIAFFGSIPKALRWQSLGLYLMIVLQYITVGLSDSIPYVTALHPVIAMLLFWRSLVIVRAGIALFRKQKT